MNRPQKIRGILLAFFLFLAFVQTGMSAEAGTPAPKGKIVILVLDISGSIRPYFDTIRQVLDKAIVKKRLGVGDYFELIPFGDDAKPMYSGQIFRVEDTSTIMNSLNAMKADNDFTDIGSALKVSLDQIVQLKKQKFDLFEPLVLFITDGDHQPKASSPFKGQTMDEIFKDPFIGDRSLYNGWYIVGIGKNLKDLKRMAELSGREKYFITIEDLNKLESELDRWVSQIPPAKSLEVGEVQFTQLNLGGSVLQKEGTTLIPLGATALSWTLLSTYKQTPAKMELLQATGSFQSLDKTVTVPVELKVETGLIDLPPLSMKATNATLNFSSPVAGKGTLKLDFPAQVNHVEQPLHLEYSVEFLSSGEIFLRTWLLPVVILVVLIVLFVLYQILKGYFPIPVTMEIIGKPLKFRAVKLGVGKKAEFGVKPGLAFKLDQAGSFGNVIGYLERSGKSAFRVVVRESAFFVEPDKLSPYSMNTAIKLRTKDGNDISIRFKAKVAGAKSSQPKKAR